MSAQEKVAEIVKSNDVVLFMKGNPMFPQCGFSARATGILQQCGVKFAHVNVLADPDVREAVKAYSAWPTIPQLFIKGEFVGGSDIMMEMYESGELQKLISAS